MGSSQGKPTAPAMSPAAAAAAAAQPGAFKPGVPCSGVQAMNDAADGSGSSGANPFANGDCPVPEEYRGKAGSTLTCGAVCPPCHPPQWRPSFLERSASCATRHVVCVRFRSFTRTRLRTATARSTGARGVSRWGWEQPDLAATLNGSNPTKPPRHSPHVRTEDPCYDVAICFGTGLVCSNLRATSPPRRHLPHARPSPRHPPHVRLSFCEKCLCNEVARGTKFVFIRFRSCQTLKVP